MQCRTRCGNFDFLIVCLHIDAAADSNKEGWPLVTVSSKDSFGKMFIVLRAFLPNEQSWSYKWFFHTVLPSLRRLEKNKNNCDRRRLPGNKSA
jgi:hypothetical protein